MIIRTLKQSEEPGHLELTGLLTEEEYAELNGHLNDLRIFSDRLVTESANTIRSGARHSFAKYLLFPVTLRRRWRTDKHDFERLRCGTFCHRGMLYVIYAIPAKSTSYPVEPRDE